MLSDLIAVIFPESGNARQAWRFTNTLQDRRTYGLGCVALISKDVDGNSDLKHYYSSDIPKNSRQQVLLSRLTDAIFDNPTELAVQRSGALGLDGLFVEQVNRSMGPERSALLIYLAADSLADIDHLLTFLNLMKASVFRTTLPHSVEEALLTETWNSE